MARKKRNESKKTLDSLPTNQKGILLMAAIVLGVIFSIRGQENPWAWIFLCLFVLATCSRELGGILQVITLLKKIITN